MKLNYRLSPAGASLIIIYRDSLDKEKGVVKGGDILSGAEHRLLLLCQRVGTGALGHHREITFGGSLHQPSIRSSTSTMIVLCGHPVAAGEGNVGIAQLAISIISLRAAPVLDARAPNQRDGRVFSTRNPFGLLSIRAISG